MVAYRLVLDDLAIDEMLNTPEGPVGLMLEELGTKATAVAAAAAPIMKPQNFGGFGKAYNPRYQYGPPGMTKASVRYHMAYTKGGTLYSGVNAAYGPTLFLEKPAEQIHTMQYAFLTIALDSITL